MDSRNPYSQSCLMENKPIPLNATGQAVTAPEWTAKVDTLKGRARELAEASIPESTRRAYQGALQRLSDTLDGRKATDARLAAGRFQARVMGQPSPIGPATERVLAGIRRQGRERGRGQVAGVRDAAIVSVMSDALLRVGEVAALAVVIRGGDLVFSLGQGERGRGVQAFHLPKVFRSSPAPQPFI